MALFPLTDKHHNAVNSDIHSCKEKTEIADHPQWMDDKEAQNVGGRSVVGDCSGSIASAAAVVV